MEKEDACMLIKDDVLLMDQRTGRIGFTDEGRAYYTRWFERYGHVLLPEYRTIDDWVLARREVLIQSLEDAMRRRRDGTL